MQQVIFIVFSRRRGIFAANSIRDEEGLYCYYCHDADADGVGAGIP